MTARRAPLGWVVVTRDGRVVWPLTGMATKGQAVAQARTVPGAAVEPVTLTAPGHVFTVGQP